MTYHYLRYNHHQVLRPNWLFWLLTLYLSHHAIILAAIGIAGGRVGSKGANMRGAVDLSDLFLAIAPAYMISNIPSILLIIVLGSRTPKGGQLARAFWRHGRAVLASSVLLFLAVFFLREGFQVTAYGSAQWLGLGGHALAALVLVFSIYLKDMFAEFPAAEAVPES